MARDYIETDAKIFWAQLELENQEAEEILRGAGREDIVMNRCIKQEHTRLISETPIRFINDKQLIIEENPSLLGFLLTIQFPWLGWPVKWRGPCLICLFDHKGNLAVDKSKAWYKADDIVGNSRSTNQSVVDRAPSELRNPFMVSRLLAEGTQRLPLGPFVIDRKRITSTKLRLWYCGR